MWLLQKLYSVSDCGVLGDGTVPSTHAVLAVVI